MNREDYLFLYQLEENYWWFRGMRDITSSILDTYYKNSSSLKVLDAGCGTGIMLSWLKRYTSVKPVVGIDFSWDALKLCQKRNHSIIALGTVTMLPFKSSYFDLITCFDVICQLPPNDSDIQALKEVFRALKIEGKLYLRVPAYERIRSGHDQALQTYHRYTLGEIVKKVEEAGFVVERASYANALLLPAAILRRFLKRVGSGGSDVKPFPRYLAWLNGIFLSLLNLEAKYLAIEKRHLPFGLSVICLARKPRPQEK